jgi:arylsulfatase A-like enzyme
MEVPNDAPYSDEPWPQTEKNKAAMITRLDTYVGRLLDKLQELKIDDNTIIIFTSDNGPHQEGGVDPKFFQSAGPLRGIKRDLYEGGIRVPLIVRWPMKVKAGAVNGQAWAFWDFLPTAAEIAQAKAPGQLDGISMLPTLLGKPQTNHHDFLYWEFHERGFQQAVRIGDWKAVRPQPGAPLELYNLKTDLGEKQNVAGQNPEVIAKIEAYLKSARTESEHWPIKPAKLPAAKKEPEK